jgi:hypothetical protein
MGLLVINRDGEVIGYVDSNDEANELLESLPDDIYTFFVGGFDEDVSDFLLKLNDDSNGESFFDVLKTKYGRVPTEINPFEEIRDAYLRFNTFFIKINYNQLNNRLAAQMFSVLYRTLPAGSAFFVEESSLRLL